MRYSIDPKFDPALAFYVEAALLLKALDEMLSAYTILYGTEGYFVSGGFYSTWPDFAKDRVRTLNAGINALLSEARRARPKGVRETTMLRLWRQVEEMLKSPSAPKLPPGPLKAKAGNLPSVSNLLPGIFTTKER